MALPQSVIIVFSSSVSVLFILSSRHVNLLVWHFHIFLKKTSLQILYRYSFKVSINQIFRFYQWFWYKFLYILLQNIICVHLIEKINKNFFRLSKESIRGRGDVWCKRWLLLWWWWWWGLALEHKWMCYIFFIEEKEHQQRPQLFIWLNFGFCLPSSTIYFTV